MIPDGMLWNEAIIEAGDPLNDGLLMLLFVGTDLVPSLIGTAFIVAADFSTATAITAAHCLEEVRRLLNPNSIHAPSTPAEFLPPPKEINLQQVKAIYQKGDQVFTCDVRVAIWDRKTDLAVLHVIAPNDATHLFSTLNWITDEIPSIGAEVLMIGYGELKVEPGENGHGTILRRLVVRLGRIESVHAAGDYMLQCPFVQTTIQVYGGMSGGMVCRSTPGEQLRPFGFISHSPQISDEFVQDRSVSGHSVGAILNAGLGPLGERKQAVTIRMDDVGVGSHSTD